MGDVGRLDDPGLLQLHARRDVVEQALAAAEDHRHLVDQQLVEEAGADQLLDRLAAAADRDVLVAGGLAGELDRALQPLGDEVEGGLAEGQRLALVVGEDEDRDRKGGSSPHQPFQSGSVQGPRTGPNMLRPMTTAPVPAAASSHDLAAGVDLAALAARAAGARRRA